MPAENIKEKISLNKHEKPTKAQKDLAKNKRKIISTLESLYSHPWRIYLLKKVFLPTSIFNSFFKKEIYDIFSNYSEHNLHHALKECLSRFAKTVSFDSDLLQAINNVSFNKDQISLLNNIVKKRQLSITDQEQFISLIEKSTLDSNIITPLSNILTIKLPLEKQKELKQLAARFYLTETQRSTLLNLTDKTKLTKSIRNKLKAIAKLKDLPPHEADQLNLIAVMDKLIDKDVAILHDIANKPFFSEEHSERLTLIANSSNYSLDDRKWLQALGKEKSLNALTHIAEDYPLPRNEINSIKKIIHSCSSLTQKQYELLSNLATTKQFDTKTRKLLKTLSKNSYLKEDKKNRLGEIIKEPTQFKLNDEFLLEEFLQDHLVPHFLNTIQDQYRASENKQLNTLELQALDKIAKSYTEASDSTQNKQQHITFFKRLITIKELSKKDSKHLEAIMANPNLSAIEINDLKATFNKRHLNNTEKAHLAAIATNPKSQLDEFTLKNLNDISKKRMLEKEDREFLIRFTQNPAFSSEDIDTLSEILRNEQLTHSAREHLSPLKKTLNRLADDLGLSEHTKITWSEDNQCYIQSVKDETARKEKIDSLDRVENVLAQTESSEEQLKMVQRQRRSTIVAPLIEKQHGEHTPAVKIKQRYYKKLINNLSRPFSYLFAVSSGIIAIVVVLAAFSFNPPLAIILACVAGLGAFITRHQLNKNDLAKFLIHLFIKGNFWRNLSWTQASILAVLNIVSLVGAVGLGLFCLSLLTTKLVLIFTALGIICPPLVPLAIGAALSALFVPLIIALNFVIFSNLSYELIKHNSVKKFFKFLHKNFIQAVKEAENFSDRIAQLCKCLALIILGLLSLALVGAAAVIAGIILQEATEPFLHLLTHLTHMGEGLVVAIETTFLIIAIGLSSIRFLTSTDHFAHMTNHFADLAKRAILTLLRPLQNFISRHAPKVDNNIALTKQANNKRPITQRVKSFFEAIPRWIKEVWVNPWKLNGIVKLVQNLFSSTAMVVNGAADAAAVSAVNVPFEILEVSGIIFADSFAKNLGKLVTNTVVTKPVKAHHVREIPVGDSFRKKLLLFSDSQQKSNVQSAQRTQHDATHSVDECNNAGVKNSNH